MERNILAGLVLFAFSNVALAECGIKSALQAFKASQQQESGAIRFLKSIDYPSYAACDNEELLAGLVVGTLAIAAAESSEVNVTEEDSPPRESQRNGYAYQRRGPKEVARSALGDKFVV